SQSFSGMATFTPKSSPWMKTIGFGEENGLPYEPIKLLVLREHADLLKNLQAAIQLNEELKQANMTKSQMRMFQSSSKMLTMTIQEKESKDIGLLCEIRAVYLYRVDTSANPSEQTAHFLQLFGISQLQIRLATENVKKYVDCQIPYHYEQPLQQPSQSTASESDPDQSSSTNNNLSLKQNLKGPRPPSIFINLINTKPDEPEEKEPSVQQGPRKIAYGSEMKTEQAAQDLGFVCPISTMIMVDPVRASDGQAYEREYIQEIMKKPGAKSPMTKNPLGPDLIPDLELKQKIEDYLKQFPDHPLNPI
ncbi:MAG: hypothetical protein EZS28_035199, partial [Streblomastix strix]